MDVGLEFVAWAKRHATRKPMLCCNCCVCSTVQAARPSAVVHMRMRLRYGDGGVIGRVQSLTMVLHSLPPCWLLEDRTICMPLPLSKQIRSSKTKVTKLWLSLLRASASVFFCGCSLFCPLTGCCVLPTGTFHWLLFKFPLLSHPTENAIIWLASVWPYLIWQRPQNKQNTLGLGLGLFVVCISSQPVDHECPADIQIHT